MTHRLENEYTTDTGILLRNVHDESEECREFGCVIHNPTDPHRDERQTHWIERIGGGRIVRIDRNGDIHEDADVQAFLARKARKIGNPPVFRVDEVVLTIQEARDIASMLRYPSHWEASAQRRMGLRLDARAQHAEEQNAARQRLVDMYPSNA